MFGHVSLPGTSFLNCNRLYSGVIWENQATLRRFSVHVAQMHRAAVQVSEKVGLSWHALAIGMANFSLWCDFIAQSPVVKGDYLMLEAGIMRSCRSEFG